ncbi:MAG: hypothetical protein EPN94_11820 [Nitrospirae bacterium]|nr:MAG: hypothetical protein EPN94_11820 [Nitrospirota bacterium]
MTALSKIQRQAAAVCLAVISFFLLSSFQVFAADKKTIGVIMTGDIPYYSKMHKAFTARLSKEGYGDAQVLLQRPYPDQVSWSNAARKLIAVDVDIIVTYGASVTLAAINERTSIPIVYAGVYNPDAIGITGKNTTGSISKVPTSSLIRYLKGITNISNLGVLYSDIEKESIRQAKDLEDISKDMGFTIVKINIRRAEDVRKIKAAGKLDALFLTCSASVNMSLNAILEIARAGKLPTASSMKGENNSGVVITLSASPEEQGELAAERVVKILRGAHPNALPPASGKNIELIFNLKENMEMGFKIPMGLVTEATKIIQ